MSSHVYQGLNSDTLIALVELLVRLHIQQALSNQRMFAIIYVVQVSFCIGIHHATLDAMPHLQPESSELVLIATLHVLHRLISFMMMDHVQLLVQLL